MKTARQIAAGVLRRVRPVVRRGRRTTHSVVAQVRNINFRNQPWVQDALTQPSAIATQFKGSPIIAREDAAVNFWCTPAAVADQVMSVLREAGIDHFTTDLPYSRVPHIALKKKDAARAFLAFQERLGRAGYYVRAKDTNASSRALPGLTPQNFQQDSAIWIIFQYIKNPITGRLLGPDHGCEIHLWHEVEPDVLCSPQRNATIQRCLISDVGDITERLRWDGVATPRLSREVSSNFSALDFPVDAIYMWVNDLDPEWRARREARRKAIAEGHEFSAEYAKLVGVEAAADQDVHLYRDRGELRASLRSLEMYAPWFDKIIIVTDQQTPEWLADNDRVKVVDHREFFREPSNLPTFNSHAIGSQLHNIPGLNEHYVVLNDDVMFNRPLSPYSFFTPQGQPKVVFSRTLLPSLPREYLSVVEQARLNSAELIEEKFSVRPNRLFAHVPIPQRRSLAIEVESLFDKQISRTAASPFRSSTDVEMNSWLHHYYGILTGQVVEHNYPFGYFNTGDPVVRRNMTKAWHRYRRVHAFCVNDVPPADAAVRDADPDWLHDWLHDRFPIPGNWERS